MRTLITTAVVLATACSTTPNYYYAPEQAQVARNGYPTRIENVPAEEPEGTVAVSTMGIATTQRGDRALHVRLAVANEGDSSPWTVDVRQQLVDVPGAGRAYAESANAGAQSLPVVTVPRRDKRIIDLYFPLPPGVDTAGDLAGFDVLWQVDTAAREVSGRTHVDRREIVEPPSTTVVVGGWGPYWWYDPFWPRVPYRTVHVAPRGHVHVRR